MSTPPTTPPTTHAWRFTRQGADSRSLPEVHSSIHVPNSSALWWRRFLAFIGPGYMISVGYMDPGNWATDLQGGSQFGYHLLWVIMLSNLMAIVLQALAARLGIVTGRDLAQACRDHFSPVVSYALWVSCELAIIACDLAEVIGTAVALQLLFGLPLIGGCVVSIADAFIVLLLMQRGFRYLEAFIIGLLIIIAGCFVVQIIAAVPSISAMLHGFVPTTQILTDPSMLYIAIGIIGATVMPHNLYLHSSIVQTRAFERTPTGQRDAIKWSTLDSTIALVLALFINAAILIVAAAAFHGSGHQDVAEISDAYRLLSPVLGVAIASTLFATALLAAGMNSTITGTLAGQIIMEGFLHLSLPAWARRLLTRGLAVIPVLFVTLFYGEHGVGELLMFSQVILSMQLPFAVIPLVMFVSDREKMGEFTISPVMKVLAWVIATIILVLNFKLLWDTVTSAS
ncbi:MULTISPECIES: Nramp family divalent metal transporter [Novacetimonas]|uniref:Divalent metal cation transporter MntH n=1 Tax=Novacetimonas hansenii TaxID=436 RepID=A0AAW5EPX7_NOVHA|nr:Nramp family divalent metal transporter [Novacetimonas hansenii]MCJ8353669.1 Nramp family divalent metal transporter [Novacetimonas hansenii]PYD74060.1 divalent metal cation transporter [Novacetimonas hansenii]RFP02723.1 divalent metal cation transporter [Novacetimonas hansenii]WEQ59393.1 Nramp family divalent metal transporter [Novacetimonas hansenii]CUW46984.1 Divalent metal cation transporter MntH [Novacetimonas hansenii]